jgi:hypothetical protein
VIKFTSKILAHGRWFSPGIPASSTTKTGCHDIAEILLKVALNTKNQINTNLLSFHYSLNNYIKVISYCYANTQMPTMGKYFTRKLYHLQLRVEYTLFSNLQSRALTHAVLVLGLYELSGNPTT